MVLRLTGGNPRALINMRSRGLELWLRADVIDVLARVVEGLRDEWGVMCGVRLLKLSTTLMMLVLG